MKTITHTARAKSGMSGPEIREALADVEDYDTVRVTTTWKGAIKSITVTYAEDE